MFAAPSIIIPPCGLITSVNFSPSFLKDTYKKGEFFFCFVINLFLSGSNVAEILYPLKEAMPVPELKTVYSSKILILELILISAVVLFIETGKSLDILK